jgi:hypothetical protein
VLLRAERDHQESQLVPFSRGRREQQTAALAAAGALGARDHAAERRARQVLLARAQRAPLPAGAHLAQERKRDGLENRTPSAELQRSLTFDGRIDRPSAGKELLEPRAPAPQATARARLAVGARPARRSVPAATAAASSRSVTSSAL